jgi:hypothetical protein
VQSVRREGTRHVLRPSALSYSLHAMTDDDRQSDELLTDGARAWVAPIKELLETLPNAPQASLNGLERRLRAAGSPELTTSSDEGEPASHYLAAAAAELTATRAEIRQRARQSYWLVVIMGILTMLLAVASSVFYSISLAASGVVSTVGTAVLASPAGIFFRIYKTEAERADQVLHDLQVVEELRLRFELAQNALAGASPQRVARLPPTDPSDR